MIRAFSFLIVLVIVFFGLINNVHAEVKSFVKEYTYEAGELDSKSTSRTLALEQAKRALLEELGVFLTSNTEVVNSQLKKDEITTITAGIVSAVVIEEKWDGHKYWLKAKIDADPDVVLQAIKAIRADKDKSRDLEIARKRVIQLTKDLEAVKLNLSDNPEDRRKKYIKIVNQKSASDFVSYASSLYYSKGFAESSSAYNEAMAAIDKAIVVSPDFIEAYLLKADITIEVNNDFHSAIDYLSQSISHAEKTTYDKSRLYEKRAVYYWKVSNFKSAINDYMTALNLNPNGVLYSKLSYDDLNIDTFVNKFPKDYRSYLIRARYNAHFIRDMRLYDKSISDSRKSLKLKPDNPLAYYLITEAYSYKAMKNNNLLINKVDYASYNSMAVAATNGISLSNDNTWKLRFYKIRAYDYLMLKDYLKAISDYTKALTLDNKDAGIYNDRALAYRALKQYDKAIKDIDIAITLPHSAINWPRNAYEVRASIYEEISDYANAIADYTSALDIWKKEFGEFVKFSKFYSTIPYDILEKRAEAHQKINDYTSAINDYEEAITWLPKSYSASTHTDIAINYYNLNNNDKALDELNKAIAKFRSEDIKYTFEAIGLSDAYRIKANILRTSKSYKLAIDNYNLSLDVIQNYNLNKNNIYVPLCRTYQDLNINSEAIRCFYEAVKSAELSNNLNIELLSELGWAEMLSGNKGKGLAVFSKMVKLYPKSPFAYSERGQAFIEHRDYKSAIIELKKALKIDPLNSAFYYFIADAYMKSGQWDNTVESMKTSSKLGHPMAKEWLKKQKIL